MLTGLLDLVRFFIYNSVMQTLNLTDKEFLHYQELYNQDPIVQRLCKIQFADIHELQDQVAELTEQVENLESDLEYAIDEKNEAKREVRILREKIHVWSTLEEE